MTVNHILNKNEFNKYINEGFYEIINELNEKSDQYIYYLVGYLNKLNTITKIIVAVNKQH